MNQKDFNALLNNITTLIIPLNQLLYECLIIIILYYLFNALEFRNVGLHKPFIYLIAIIFIGLDWFIWDNHIQTALFICILIIYITYNFHKAKTISRFIDFVNDARNNVLLEDKNNKELNKINNNNIIIKQKEQDELDQITYIPKYFDIKNKNNRNIDNNKSPDPYNKEIVGLNDIYDAYASTNLPSTHIVDSTYAEVILNNLYETPQYKSIKPQCTDNTLQNNIHQNTRSVDEIEAENKLNMNLFKNPKKEFLDSKWLESKDYKYNDTCSGGCTTDNSHNSHNSQKKHKAQNAICSLAKFGYELEECTNQEGTINEKQLKMISTNSIKPMI